MVFFLKYLLNLVDVPSGHELSSYYTRDDDRGALRGMRDTDSLGASYDRYLRSAVLGLLFFIFRPQFQCSVIICVGLMNQNICPANFILQWGTVC